MKKIFVASVFAALAIPQFAHALPLCNAESSLCKQTESYNGNTRCVKSTDHYYSYNCQWDSGSPDYIVYSTCQYEVGGC